VSDWALSTTGTITFVMVDSNGTEVTGLGSGFTLQVSKNGGAFAASSGTKAEIGSGWYSYIYPAAEADTLGEVSIRVTGAGCVQQNLVYQVAAARLSLSSVVEGTLTLQHALRLLIAWIAGKTSGANTGTITYKSQDGATDRIVLGVDGDGERLTTAVDGS